MSARSGTVNINRWAGPRSRSRLKQGDTSSKRAAKGGKTLRNVPSMKEFLHKQTIVKQYRGFLRSVAMIPDEQWRIHARDEVRQSFGAYKQETDNLSISMAIKEGDRRLNELQNMVGYTHSTTKTDTDSWLNIDDKDDPRGRVGLEWPWDKSEDEDEPKK